ncbi:hypothetical protein ABIA31_003190 [Catenulispora sp. MAP5-51]|uniref:hypothetical protein n=1 Tax=Catenulispora sp. MAP5-51 TaxID=3156298 RepID=UPI003518A419
MEDGFEEHLAGMMDYRTDPAAPVSAAGARIAARRRGRMRAIGTAGSALAVAAVGIGVATLNGSGGHGAAAGPGLSAGVGGGVTPAAVSSPPVTGTGTSPSASPTGSRPGTTVRVASGTTITVTDGFSVRVTDTEACYTASPTFIGLPATTPDAPGCIDTTDPNVRRRPGAPANLSAVTLPRGGGLLAVFQGPEIPVRAEVLMLGKRYPATLVSTPGMKDWIALYALLPPEPADMTGSPGLVAYDASGKVLAQHADRETPIPTKSGNGK